MGNPNGIPFAINVMKELLVMSQASCKNRYGVRYLLKEYSGPERPGKEVLRREQNTTFEEDEARD